MGIFKKPSSSSSSSSTSTPQRAFYPSGPWINRIRPPDDPAPTPAANPDPRNPDPASWRIIRAAEERGFLVVRINFPNCTNYEGDKILVHKGITLIQLVNQKAIDPHFFQDKVLASPIARLVPTEEGWDMAITLVRALSPKAKTRGKMGQSK